MKAVILAGGFGTRISEATQVEPKPMVAIGGRPILWHIMKIYSTHGVNDFVICCGHRGYIIKEYFANYVLHASDVTVDMRDNKVEVRQNSTESWRVTLVDTGEDTMTGGRLKRVRDYLDEDHFCFTYGDGVGNIDVTKLLEFHRRGGKLATVTATQPPARFGALEVKDGLVRSFQEKPSGHTGWINGGFFVLSTKVFDYIEGDSTIWEGGPIEQLVHEGQMQAWLHHGFWQPMDTLRDKNYLERLWASGNAPWKIWQRVFVTGHTGFKGGWLCLWLQSMGAQVMGYALDPPTHPNLFEVARVGENMKSIMGDVRNLDHLVRALAESQPEIVIHMAAQSLVRLSYKQPVETYSTNVMGTVHMLEAVRLTPSVRAVVNVTSDKCYQNREWLWGYRETEPMGGFDPYSSSKGCAELVTDAFRNSYFSDDDLGHRLVAVASCRSGNVIGGGDWAYDRLIPDILQAVRRDIPVQIRSPKAIRPWQHVLEAVGGYLVIAEKLLTEGSKFSGGWNFGPNDVDAMSVEWIVNHLMAGLCDGRPWQKDTRPQPVEATYLKLDCSKAKALLGWSPRWTLSEALDHIIEWQDAFLQGADMRAVSLSQISAYVIRDGPVKHDITSAHATMTREAAD